MSQKGKFINAFQSIQMLGGYEGENNIEENKNISEENKNNIEGNKNNDAPEIPLETGEELYNPLEGLDEESNDAQNMVISQSPVHPENTSIDKIIEEKPEQTNVIGNNNKTINSPIFNDPSIDTSREVSDITSQEDNLVIDINDTTVVSNISLTETLLSDEKTLTTKEKKDFVDDTDELLGTALAELEEEEREEKAKQQQALQKKQVKDKEQKKDISDKKKKKKKKLKKKGKDKEDDQDDDKKKKKKKHKKKSKEEKETTEKKTKKEKKKHKDKDKDKTETKEKLQVESKQKEEKSKDKSKSSSSSSKDKESTRSHSKDRKNDHKHDDKHSTKSRDRKDRKHSPKSKRSSPSEKHKDHKSSKDKHSRKRSSRDRDSPERDHKKSRYREPESKSKTHEPSKLPQKSIPIQDEKPSPSTKGKTTEPPSTKLSKEEFYQIQKQALQGKLVDIKDSSSSLTDSDEENPDLTHRTLLIDNFENEFKKLRKDTHNDLETNYIVKNEHEKSNHSSKYSKSKERKDKHSKSKSPKKSHGSDLEIDLHSPRKHELSIDLSQELNDQEDDSLAFDSSKSFTKLDDVGYDNNLDYSSNDEMNYKSNKAGSLSLREYKERNKPSSSRHSESRSYHHSDSKRRERKKSESKHSEKESFSKSSASKKDTSNSPIASQQSPKNLYDRENKENVPYTRSLRGSILDRKRSRKDSSHSGENGIDTEEVSRRDENTIPLLFESNGPSRKKSNVSSDGSDNNDLMISSQELSPYNPEAASPLDLGSSDDDLSPGIAALEDRTGVDFHAYKDVVAFEDIMKSKVKHEARKHKRKKLEDMKTQLDNDETTSKTDRKLVDHLIRQAQVEELMKQVLKQYFKSKEITKEEYKNILKKAVPQVTMSDSPIIPEKIQSLMVKFVRKCKGQRLHDERKRRKQRKNELEMAQQQEELQRQLKTNAEMLDSLQPFQQQMRVLNPNLPMPPM